MYRKDVNECTYRIKCNKQGKNVITTIRTLRKISTKTMSNRIKHCKDRAVLGIESALETISSIKKLLKETKQFHNIG